MNKDGNIDNQEFAEFFKKLPNETNEAFKKVDINNDGHIDYSEFIAATISAASTRGEHLLKGTFEQYDKDGDGKLSLEEIKEAMLIKEYQAKKILEEMDEDGNHFLEESEFIGAFNNLE